MTRISRILGIANPSLRTSRVLPSLAALFGMAAILGFVVQGAAQSNPPPKKPAVKHSKLLAATHKVVKSSKLLANKSAVKGQVYADTIMRALVKPNQSTSIVKAIAPKVTQKPDPKSMVTWLAARHDGRSDQARSSIKEWFDLADKAHTKDAKNSPAQPHSPSDTATADLLNADFAEAIQTVARQTGTSFVIAPEKFPKVSVKLVDMPFVEALNAICFAGEASWRRQGNIYYFFHRKEGQDTITDRATVEFEHVTLTEAVGRLARLYGADIEMPERDTRGNIPVIRVDLDNRTISESLFAVCQIVGANWHCEDGVYKISWPH